MGSRNTYDRESKERDSLLADEDVDQLPLAESQNTVVPKGTWRFLGFAVILLVFLNIFMLFWLFIWPSEHGSRLITTKALADKSVTKEKLAKGIAGWGLVQNAEGELSVDPNPSPRLRTSRGLLDDAKTAPVDHARMIIGADGLPIVATSNTTHIALTQCLTVACTYSTTSTLFSDDKHHNINSFALLLSNWGNPLFAASSGSTLSLVYCQDAKCAHKPVTSVLTQGKGGRSIQGIHAQLNGRNPSFLYVESGLDQKDVDTLYWITCVDPGCYSSPVKNNITSVQPGSLLYFTASLTVDSFPLISAIYAEGPSTILARYHCSDSSCSEITTNLEKRTNGLRTLHSTRLADGHILLSVAGVHDNHEGVYVTRCTNIDCSERADFKTIAIAQNSDEKFVLIGAQLDPITGYPYFLFDSLKGDHGLQFAYCHDPLCAKVRLSVPLATDIYAFSNSLATPGDGMHSFVAKTNSIQAMVVHATSTTN